MNTLARTGSSLQRGGIVITTMEEAWRMAKAIVVAGMQPKSFGEIERGAPDEVKRAQFDKAVSACFVAMQAGAEIGLSPMASIQNIAVINGKPGIYGPAALAVVEASGKLEEIHEGWEGEGEKRLAFVVLKRVDRKERRFTFSVTDAKRAGLWDKAGPWKQYPDRMLLARARGFALRDVFPDVLLGLYSIDELTAGAAAEVHQVPAPPPVNVADLIDAAASASATAPAPALNESQPSSSAPASSSPSSNDDDFYGDDDQQKQ